MHIKKGMTVRVISGNNRGEEGKVLHVFPKKERVIVEGVNFIKRHTRPSQENPPVWASTKWTRASNWK